MPTEPATILSIWRPDAAASDGDPSDGFDPFDGIESFVCDCQDVAMELANRLADEHEDWHFHIETAKQWGT